MSENKLYKVSSSLETSGYKTKIREYEVKTTPKCYVCDIENIRINKDRIMKIDTIMVENHSSIRYFIYCLNGQQEEALSMLKKHITDKIIEYKSEIDLKYQHLMNYK